jgi:rhodanese-related sulfurtransferase
MTISMDARSLREMLDDGLEYALIDVREQGLFGARHILLAVNIPLSRFELEIRRLVPRLGTRVVLCDGGEGVAARAAELMAAAGYANVALLEGGVDAWAAAGFELFSGVNVPSKLFGEYVEHHFGTPGISVEECKAMMADGTDMVILDSRPFAEFNNVTIPGAIDTPGAELVLRVRDLAPNPETLVVVNCGGRTRSIIGAQALINAGLPNRVVDLTNGTMGWRLAGYELEKGAHRQCGPVSAEAIAWAQAAAGRVAERFGVRSIDAAGLAAWQAEEDRRSLYVLDVRFPEEFAAGHLPGSRSAPGGQLVQATDEYVATRHARIVLVDDNGVRATITASWLVQLGWKDVAVLRGGLAGLETVSGADEPEIPELSGLSLPAAEVDDLREGLADGSAAVIDFSDSLTYGRGHIPGAWWANRVDLAAAAENLPDVSMYVVMAPEKGMALLGGRDLLRHTKAAVKWLPGGLGAWTGAGFEAERGSDRTLSEPNDKYHRFFGHPTKAEAAMKQYLEWEINLIDQIKRDGTLSFPHFAP